ncbi:MAG: 2-amino-4-hydroxy-6-hydroxymethyldihydropteridine diphosphokinase [Smithellaceae bacterium]|nr:2-amino-4-hydroxy-6-hydroxymethyldihydropteridine diphosphokinase [Smithellaceae bacterium]
MDGVISFVGVGSNLGDGAANCRQAMDLLSLAQGGRVIRAASLYRTEPVGLREQPWFINTVAEVRTTLSARGLLSALKKIEEKMGREEAVKWGPRIIDLDILLYGQEVIEEEGLIIPHPEMHKRRFVLEPLNEIASYVIHPAFGISVKGLLDRLDDESRVERAG